MMPRFASTKTPLGASGAVTLDLQTGREDTVTGMVFADQAGTIFIEQSMDGQNWDVSTSYPVTASDGKGFSEAVVAPYVRVRFVNGATPQGTFRLSARLSSAGNK